MTTWLPPCLFPVVFHFTSPVSARTEKERRFDTNFNRIWKEKEKKKKRTEHFFSRDLANFFSLHPLQTANQMMQHNYHQHTWRAEEPPHLFPENFLWFQKCLQVKIKAVFGPKCHHKMKKAVEEARNHILSPTPTVEQLLLKAGFATNYQHMAHHIHCLHVVRIGSKWSLWVSGVNADFCSAFCVVHNVFLSRMFHPFISKTAVLDC